MGPWSMRPTCQPPNGSQHYGSGSRSTPGLADDSMEDAIRLAWSGLIFNRSDALEWIEEAKECGVGRMVPPVDLILFRDLLEEGWGWKRLVRYEPGFVKWDEFKKYLVDYFNNSEPETFGLFAAEKNDLINAARKCLKKERILLGICVDALTPDDKSLILQIKKQAEQIQSEGDQSLIATICLECIAKEAELIFNYLLCGYTRKVAICNKIRQSALNLMLYKGPESTTVAGAMVGITTEAKLLLDLFSRDDHDIFLERISCEDIRKSTASVLTRLEKEIAVETAAPNNTLVKPMGVGDARDLNSEVSASMEGCMDMDEDSGNNQAEGMAKDNLKLEDHENETTVAALMTAKN